MIDIQLNTLPGLEHLADTDVFPGNETPCPHTPVRKKEFVFRPDLVNKILGWLTCPSDDGLLFFGDMGTGKSSTLRQLHAWLNRPLFSISGEEGMEFSDLLGTKEIIAGDTKALDGPLIDAAKFGGTFLFEEIDRAPERVSVGLNSVLDGYPIRTLDGGEIVTPRPGFKVAATANTSGSGDMTGNYNTSNVMDSSLMDRFWSVQVPYPTEDQELTILERAFGDVFPSELLRRSIALANDIRHLSAGNPERASNKASKYHDQSIDTTFSTRALLRTLQVMGTFGSVSNPLYHALDIALTSRVSATSREVIHQIAFAHFGEESPLGG